MQKKTFVRYSKLAVSIKSKGRIHSESLSSLRSPYQRDRDRVIHSTAFRRLKHKTQVFVNTAGDHYRTRITHSLEVAQIARTLAKYFNLNEDLCETLSLSHDLGHTPFGHAGEDALNDCMDPYGGFDHNIQTLRIVTLLENKYYNFKGLNLSIETIDGLVKHNGRVPKQVKFTNILGKNFFKNKINYLSSPSLEAQIASISDDIAYNSHDLEDGLRAKLYTIEDLKNIPILSSIIAKHKKFIKIKGIELVLRQIIRGTINVMVNDIILNTQKNIKKQKINSINDIYNSKTPLVSFSTQMQLFDISIKSFLKERMYFSKNVLKKTNNGKKIIKGLFLMIKKNPSKFIKKSIYQRDNVERNICDFIAGMTDRYAINLFNSLK
ncbi:MAG: dGTPase [Pelagibacterales bacterium]|nr:dGTPase [Pelagibacterales bacterium]|tara:strand:+ start:30 stop:1169 length:1140 start_codon:yes stop_codon:yes gene_type:complete